MTERDSSPKHRASSPVIEQLESERRAPTGEAQETERSLKARARTSRSQFESGAIPAPKPPGWQRTAHIAVWVALALPALYQIGLLAVTIGSRLTYPYDLEWMEGGMLHHAQRIREGGGIYGPPSIEFIPFLYTPLYPSILALLGGAFGVTYSVGRALSVVALIGIAVLVLTKAFSCRFELGGQYGASVIASILSSIRNKFCL